jgi:N-acetylmuramoyl-L-alanine amidase CwlA
VSYEITPRIIPAPSKRNPGLAMTAGVRFIVAHDTGNPGSTAQQNVAYYHASRDEMSASAHIFVDDLAILECIPALTAPPQKAWHVRYDVPTDNQLFGVDANDAAIGIEYCYGPSINADEAYARYVWVIAQAIAKFGLDPQTCVVGHFFLDPHRKTDPATGLAHSRRTYDQLLADVRTACTSQMGSAPVASTAFPAPGQATVGTAVNLRRGAPSRLAAVARIAPAGSTIAYGAVVENGEPVNGNRRWLETIDGLYFWSGAVTSVAAGSALPSA